MKAVYRVLGVAGLMAAAAVALSWGRQASARSEGPAPQVMAANPEEAGRYLTVIGGCNDCHTVGWDQAAGDLPDSLRLMGSPVGWVGPWGTTYAPNLRLSVNNMTESQWVEMIGARNALPPMPWPSLHSMNPADLRAVYAYLKALGPAGQPMPPAAPPGTAPTMPYVQFVLPAQPGQ
jgi:mono/diheme cytochrome c family protein